MAYYYAWLVAALCGFMLGVVIKKEMNTIYIVPQTENGGVYTCFTMIACLFEKWFLRYFSIIFWVLTYSDDVVAVAHDPLRTPIGFRVKVKGYTGVWTVHHFAPQLTLL